MSVQRLNRVLLVKLMVIAGLMFGFSWALIPLYRVICDVTGLNQVVKADGFNRKEQWGIGAEVTVMFDATVQPGLPWVVQPLTRRVRARTGEFIKVEYDITNASDHAVVGQAIPRYLPAAAAEYIKKLDCFCFRQQAFAPRETRRLPVVFVIDPDLPAAVKDITLAYTVFNIPGKND